MFQNYSQTYAAAITAIVGLLFSAAAAFGFNLPFTSDEATFIIGQIVNLGGIAWVIIHRQMKGDLNAVGGRLQ
jgi:hypothetical protein